MWRVCLGTDNGPWLIASKAVGLQSCNHKEQSLPQPKGVWEEKFPSWSLQMRTEPANNFSSAV